MFFNSLDSKFDIIRPTSENKRPVHLPQEIKDKIRASNKGKCNKFKGIKNPLVQGDKNGNWGKQRTDLAEFNKTRFEKGRFMEC